MGLQGVRVEEKIMFNTISIDGTLTSTPTCSHQPVERGAGWPGGEGAYI